MSYTNSITSKGQITIPKEFRDKLGLDKIGKAQIRMDSKNRIIITPPLTLEEVRRVLAKPSYKDPPSDRERFIGEALAKKYGVS